MTGISWTEETWKQWGNWRPVGGPSHLHERQASHKWDGYDRLDGRTHTEYPS